MEKPINEMMDKLILCAPVTKRSMFGGYGLFIEGVMFGLVATSQLYFKADKLNIGQYESAGSRPFEYDRRGKPIKMSYYSVPKKILDDLQELSAWVDSAHAAAVRSRKNKQ